MTYRYRGGSEAETPQHPQGRPLAGGLLESTEPLILTFVVLGDGELLVSPRNSEHVVCAGGHPVRTAGEITVLDGEVIEITNQSTGYCPDAESARFAFEALERSGVKNPGALTHAFEFRSCTSCHSLNVRKQEWPYCGDCDSPLPMARNL